MMYVQKASHGEHGRVVCSYHSIIASLLYPYANICSSENTEVYPVRSAGILRSLTGGYVFYESGTHLMNEIRSLQHSV